MKWFCALNADGHEFAEYADMVKVAVHSASRCTRLEPHFIYDGPENELTQCLRRRGVTVYPQRTFLYDRLVELSRQRGDPRVLAIGAGAFLRLELPAVAARAAINDEFVLYTDVDVMFTGEVVDFLSTLRPRYFAVAPELDPRDFEKMNSGVMLMNVPALRAVEQSLRQLVSDNLEALARDAWDQTAYRHFFRDEAGKPLWDSLPVEYNFKPYWGSLSGIRIVHFHGPKPRQREMFARAGELPADVRHLAKMAVGTYVEACEMWEKMFRETM